MSAAALTHARQQGEQQPHRAQIVHIDRAGEIVEAVIGLVDRTANRATRVVDHHIHMPEGLEQVTAELVGGLHIGEVRVIDVCDAPGLGDLRGHGLQILQRPRHQQHDRARGGQLAHHRLADTVRGACHQHHLVRDRRAQRVRARTRGRVEQPRRHPLGEWPPIAGRRVRHDPTLCRTCDLRAGSRWFTPHEHLRSGPRCSTNRRPRTRDSGPIDATPVGHAASERPAAPVSAARRHPEHRSDTHASGRGPHARPIRTYRTGRYRHIPYVRRRCTADGPHRRRSLDPWSTSTSDP